MKNNTRCWIAGVPVDSTTLEKAATQIVDNARKQKSRPLLILGPNAQLVTLAQNNMAFAKALRASDLSIPDGISVVLASRLLGAPLQTRVTGGDLMERLCAAAALHGLSVFLLGGLPMAAHLAAQRLRRKYPRLIIAGTYCPPLGFEHDPEENARIRKTITAAAPDLLFVAFGAPKQEIWMHENCPSAQPGPSVLHLIRRRACAGALLAGHTSWVWNGSIACCANPAGSGADICSEIHISSISY